MPKISIIIVSYNTKELLTQCLTSVFQSKIDAALEVFVVDNASEDSSAEMVAAQFPQVQLIANKENFGFAKANDQAYEKATGEYIFLLNPDTTMPETALADLLTFCSNHSPIGAVAPKLQFPDGSLQASCYHLPTIWRATQEFMFGIKDAYSKYAPNTDKPLQVEAIVGAAVFLPRTTIEVIGPLLDEKFYFYYEDIDMCRRIDQKNLPIYYLPSVAITHYHGASTKQRGSWAYEQNQRSAKIYFGPITYAVITFILKYGQKWQKLRKILIGNHEN